MSKIGGYDITLQLVTRGGQFIDEKKLKMNDKYQIPIASLCAEWKITNPVFLDDDGDILGKIPADKTGQSLVSFELMQGKPVRITGDGIDAQRGLKSELKAAPAAAAPSKPTSAVAAPGSSAKPQSTTQTSMPKPMAASALSSLVKNAQAKK